jgi:hypothetical protein
MSTKPYIICNRKNQMIHMHVDKRKVFELRKELYISIPHIKVNKSNNDAFD